MEENYEKTSIQIFTDGSKTEKGVGSGIVIFEAGQRIKSLQCRLSNRCTNNQAEQLATLKALEYIENRQTTDKTATIYTDSQITLDKIRNSNIHTYEGVSKSPRTMLITRKSLVVHEFPARVCCGGVLCECAELDSCRSRSRTFEWFGLSRMAELRLLMMIDQVGQARQQPPEKWNRYGRLSTRIVVVPYTISVQRMELVMDLVSKFSQNS